MKRSLMRVILLILFAVSSLGVASAADKPLTNLDIVKMIKAELGEETIVRAIQASPSHFDTSTDALISLKKAGASQKILDAMIGAKTPGSVNASFSPFSAADTTAWEVFLIEGNKRTQLKRGAASILAKPNFLGGATVWNVFSGSRADVQIANSTPTFEFALPVDEKPTDLVKIQKPDVKSDSRQIESAKGGLFVNSHSLDKRDVPVVVEKVEGKRLLNGSMALYRAKPANPLAPGEYLLAIRGMYYDFGVEDAK